MLKNLVSKKSEKNPQIFTKYGFGYFFPVEYSNDLDWKEFCVGSLDFMKGFFVEFIVHLLFINSLKLLTI